MEQHHTPTRPDDTDAELDAMLSEALGILTQARRLHRTQTDPIVGQRRPWLARILNKPIVENGKVIQ